MARRRSPARTVRFPKVPAGYEQVGSPSIRVTAETTYYPKSTLQGSPSAPRARRTKAPKPQPMPVKIVSIAEKARLGRR